jgi:hypothetical protein
MGLSLCLANDGSAASRYVKTMKRLVEMQSEADLLVRYPRKGETPGWYFRIDEVSTGVYHVEGSDQWGRRASHTGSDPDMLWAECERDAAEINRDTSIT